MTQESIKRFVFIDGSYFCFHRYYSIVRWWKSAFPENQDVLLDPYSNQEFKDKFIKTFVDTVKEIPKKLGIKKEDRSAVKMIVGKDCKREDIWRNEFIDKYKATRLSNDGFMGGPFFRMAYEDDLFLKGGASQILNLDKLEADDCIALAVKRIAEQSNVEIYIITSDMDYLQLHSEKVKIIDLSYKNVAEKKSSFGCAEANLFCKIVMGDTSDNIPSIFKKCGPKTALKCWEDNDYFKEKLKKENAYEMYDRNKKIVSFDCIPQDYQNDFYNKYQQIISEL
jgi:5'-3' exonuclease